LPKIYGADIDKVNELRKAGLGLLGVLVIIKRQTPLRIPPLN
jgi:hypothetical protein